MFGVAYVSPTIVMEFVSSLTYIHSHALAVSFPASIHNSSTPAKNFIKTSSAVLTNYPLSINQCYLVHSKNTGL